HGRAVFLPTLVRLEKTPVVFHQLEPLIRQFVRQFFQAGQPPPVLGFFQAREGRFRIVGRRLVHGGCPEDGPSGRVPRLSFRGRDRLGVQGPLQAARFLFVIL